MIIFKQKVEPFFISLQKQIMSESIKFIHLKTKITDYLGIKKIKIKI